MANTGSDWPEAHPVMAVQETALRLVGFQPETGSRMIVVDDANGLAPSTDQWIGGLPFRWLDMEHSTYHRFSIKGLGIRVYRFGQ